MPGRNQRKKASDWFLIILNSVLAAVCVILAVLLIRGPKTPGEVAVPTESVLQTDGTQASVETSSPTTQPAQTEPVEQTTVPAETTVPTEPTTAPMETTVPVEPTTVPTEPTTIPVEPTTEPVKPPQQPAQLASMLEKNGVTFDKLAQKDCTQLVTVTASGTTAQIRFFICEEGIWEEKTELACQGRVGRNGVAADKQEGDGCTPTGLYGIGSAFYINDMPDTGLDTFRITDKTYWVDDPNSKFYNQKVEGTQNKDWNSAEYMISYDVYRYGFVVEYNLQAVKNAGSAIFFHLGNAPTSGCIATGEKMVLAYLKALDKAHNPRILIICSDDA